MQIIDNIQQQSPEWFKLREKRMTASHAVAIGNVGKGLETYIYDMMAQYYSTAEKEGYTNADLQRGNEREPQARFIYEIETGNQVKEVCFIIKNDYVGVSPDGLVSDDGLVEIKSVNDINFFKALLEFKKTGTFTISSERVWQMQMQLEVSERKWNDYVLYNPNFEPTILIQRIYPDLKKFEALRNGYKTGADLIESIIKNYNMDFERNEV